MDCVDSVCGLRPPWASIRAIGASNTSPADVRAYLAAGRLDAIQEQYSMVHRDIEAELVPLCENNGVSIIGYSTLALGLLTGLIGPDRVFEGDDLRRTDPRYSVENRTRTTAFAEEIAPIAAAMDASIAQVVIAWTLRRPGIGYALCGARNPAQARDNARAGMLKLKDRDLELISEAANRHLDGIHV